MPAISLVCIPHRYHCQLQTSLVCKSISIQLPAIDQSCIYTYINTIVSYRPVLYLYLYQYNCQLQTSLVFMPHRYHCQLQTSLLCIPISIQLSAIDQSCIYSYINTIVSYRSVLYLYHIDTIAIYRPVLYLYLYQYNCQLQTSLVCIPHRYHSQLQTSLVCIPI